MNSGMNVPLLGTLVPGNTAVSKRGSFPAFMELVFSCALTCEITLLETVSSVCGWSWKETGEHMALKIKVGSHCYHPFSSK